MHCWSGIGLRTDARLVRRPRWRTRALTTAAAAAAACSVVVWFRCVRRVFFVSSYIHNTRFTSIPNSIAYLPRLDTYFSQTFGDEIEEVRVRIITYFIISTTTTPAGAAAPAGADACLAAAAFLSNAAGAISAFRFLLPPSVAFSPCGPRAARVWLNSGGRDFEQPRASSAEGARAARAVHGRTWEAPGHSLRPPRRSAGERASAGRETVVKLTFWGGVILVFSLHRLVSPAKTEAPNSASLSKFAFQVIFSRGKSQSSYPNPKIIQHKREQHAISGRSKR